MQASRSQFPMLPVSLIILVVILGGSCTTQNRSGKQQIGTEESAPALVVPSPLDDDWTKWIIGEWGDLCEPGSQKKRNGWMKAELGLNGQFLIIRHENEITKEDIESLKDSMRTEDDQASKFQSQTHKEIEYYTIDSKSGEVIGYLFDSLRCIAVGRGTRQGNQEVIEWKWKKGQQETTSIRTTERINENRLIMTDRYLKPDGSIWMEGTLEATRQQ